MKKIVGHYKGKIMDTKNGNKKPHGSGGGAAWQQHYRQKLCFEFTDLTEKSN